MDRRDFLKLLVILGVSEGLALIGCKDKKTPINGKKPADKPADNTKPADTNNVPKPAEIKADETSSFNILRKFIEKRAVDPDIPWAVGHGILALGFSLRMADGQRAVDYLFKFLKKKVIKGREYYHFPTGEYFNYLTDAHPNTMLKILLNCGVQREDKFDTPFGAISFQRLLDDAKMLVTPRILNDLNEPEFDWSLEVLTSLVKPDKAVWRNAFNQKVDLNALTLENLAVLENHMKPIEEFHKNKLRKTPESGLIYHDPCAGSHLLWGNLWAVSRGFGDKSTKKRIKLQAELLFYRHKYEIDMYKRRHNYIKEPDITDNQRRARVWLFFRDQFKFLSHQLESIAIIRDMNIMKFDSEMVATAEASKKLLIKTVKDLKNQEIFKWIHIWKKATDVKNDYRGIVFHDIVGDACHAYRSLKLY